MFAFSSSGKTKDQGKKFSEKKTFDDVLDESASEEHEESEGEDSDWESDADDEDVSEDQDDLVPSQGPNEKPNVGDTKSSSASGAEHTPNLCMGPMMIKGSRLSNWGRRWCVFNIENRELQVYSSAKAFKSQKRQLVSDFYVLTMEDAEVDTGTFSKHHHTHGLKLRGSQVQARGYSDGSINAEYIAYLKTENERAKWLRGIEAGIQNSIKDCKIASTISDGKTLSVAPPPRSFLSRLLHGRGEATKVKETVEGNKKKTAEHYNVALIAAEDTKVTLGKTGEDLQRQREMLDKAERVLDEISDIQDKADRSINNMSHPLMYMFHSKQEQHKRVQAKKMREAFQEEGDKQKDEWIHSAALKKIAARDPQLVLKIRQEEKDLHKLNGVLHDINNMAGAIGEEIDKSSENISTIEMKTKVVQIRLDEQAGKMKKLVDHPSAWGV